MPIDVALITVSPPDMNGYVSLGISVDITKTAAEVAGYVVAAEEQGKFTERSVESEAFRAGNKTPADLYAQAEALRMRFKTASACFGAFMGLAFCGRMIRLSVIRRNRDYVPDRGACLSCARCHAYCPVGKEDAAA